MKRALTALALLTGALVPELALAKAVEDVRLDTDAADVVVTVVADQSLEAPAVRTSPGSVRLRFYDAKETKLVHLKGDGSAVRSVDLNRGSDQSAALVINFGDRTKLAPADVRVERDGDAITLRIARGLLPAVNGAPMVAQPAAVPPAQKAPVQSAQKALPTAAAAKQTPAPLAAPAAPAATVTVRTEEVAPLAAQAAPRASDTSSGTLGTKPSEPKAAPAELKLNTSASSPMPMLLAISALLGLSYVGLQFVMRKKKLAGSDIPAIDVVAQRRIGPRHQLVIVRAFDRDYLLSVQGGQTTVIARSSRQKLVDAEALLSPLPKLRADGAENRAFEDDDEPTFGGELFKQALEQRERAREHTASTRLEQREARESLEVRPHREPTSSTRPEQRPYREPTSSTRPDQREPREARSEQRGEWREPTSSARLDLRESRDDRSEPRNDWREPAASARPERRDPTAGMRLEAVRAEARAELELERERDRERDRDREFEPHDELPVPPSAVSDSVSGLLRLRKQSGR